MCKRVIALLLAVLLLLPGIAIGASAADAIPGVFAEFLATGGYMAHVNSDGWMNAPSSYALLDIDQDGIEELLINSEDGAGFHLTYLFRIGKSGNTVEFVESFASYAGVEYSATHRALVYSYPRPTFQEGGVEFFELSDAGLRISFGLYFQRYSGESFQITHYDAYGNAISKQEIDKNTYYDYLNTRTMLNWNPLPAVEKEKRLVRIVEESTDTITTLHFDDRGLLVEEICRYKNEEDGPEMRASYIYDEAGRFLHRTGNAVTRHNYAYEYDDQGNTTYFRSVDWDSGRITEEYYHYLDGILAYAECYFEGEASGRKDYVCDTENRITQETYTYYHDGSAETVYYQYTTDTQGRIATEKRIYDWYTIDYAYDYETFKPFVGLQRHHSIDEGYDFFLEIRDKAGRVVKTIADEYWVDSRFMQVEFDADGYVKFACEDDYTWTMVYDIPDPVIDPITLKLGDAQLVSETESTSTWKILAAIKNEGNSPVHNVRCKIEPGEGAVLTEGDAEQTYATLDVRETTGFIWTIQVDKHAYSGGGDHHFTVSAMSDQTVVTAVRGTIHIEASDRQSNELNFSKDVWSFANFSHEPCELVDSHLNALLGGLSDANRAAITDALKTMGSTGHCYGMSATVILDKMGVADMTDFTGTEHIRDARKTKDTESIICYYQVTQVFDIPRAESQTYRSLPVAQQLALLAEKANAVKSGGCPVLFAFGVDGWGAHAVVAYALEPGSFTSSATGRTYNRRVLLYDCNAGSFWDSVDWEPDRCLLFNAGTDEWEIPAYVGNGAVSTNPNAHLICCTSTLNAIDPQNYDAGLYNYRAELRAKTATDLIMTQPGSSKRWTIGGSTGKVQGSSDLITYHDFCTYDSGTFPALHIVLPDEAATYTFTTVSGNEEEMDLDILYDDKYVAATGNCAGAELGYSGAIGLTGNTGEFRLTVADDKAPEGTFSTYRISGETEGDLTVQTTTDGITVTGDDLAGIIIRASDGDTEAEYVITEESGSVTLSREGDDLIPGETVKLGDVNGDGKINPKDAAMVLQYFVGKPVTGFDAAAADVNHDGKINPKDAAMILQFFVGKLTEFQ